MKKYNLHNPNLTTEVVDPSSETVKGQALSVYELYQKMIVGSIDAAGYVHPVEYDENPDIDNPDPLNTFGTTLDEVEDAQREAVAIAKRETKKPSRSEHSESKPVTEAKPTPASEAAAATPPDSTSE